MFNPHDRGRIGGLDVVEGAFQSQVRADENRVISGKASLHFRLQADGFRFDVNLELSLDGANSIGDDAFVHSIVEKVRLVDVEVLAFFAKLVVRALPSEKELCCKNGCKAGKAVFDLLSIKFGDNFLFILKPGQIHPG